MTAAPSTWVSRLEPYRCPDNRRAVFEIVITLIPLLAIWLAMWQLLQVHYLLTLVLAFPAAALLVRMFMLQHDCGHGTMFTSRSANDWVGRSIGLLTLTPYDHWRRSHALHHAGSGNLDRRGVGDIDTLTIGEYMALSKFGRLKYRIYRHPIVLFLIGPAYLFILQQRLPTGAMRQGSMPWVSTITTNLGVALIYGVMIYTIGLVAFIQIQLPIIVFAASFGVWLFYIQHQFDPTHWEKAGDWNRESAALHGSSFYDLPKPLMWLTANIGIHHVHHLSSRIPFHRLPQVMKDHPELSEVGRLTFGESLKCVRLALWDENTKELVSFREAGQRVLASAT